jgi:hypothetical protein
MKSTESTWEPFQSPQVRDICAHLTADEKRQLAAKGKYLGRQVAWRFVAPFLLVAQSFVYSVLVGFVLLGLFAIYFIAFGLPFIREQQKRQRELLCATEYSKTRGYRPDALKMFAFPWTK